MNWDHAVPVAGLAGGVMIGLACALMLLGLGRIAGVSGLAARATGLSPNGPSMAVAAVFILGLPLGAWLVHRIHGPVQVHFPTSFVQLLIGGVLVGFGTRLGSGCTSGHGICGLSRLSPRSLTATVVFLATAFLTVAALRMLGVTR